MSESNDGIFEAGDLTIDLRNRTIKRGDEQVALTYTEWKLLDCLGERARQLVPFEQILSDVWGPDYRNHVLFIRVWISRIRARLEPDLSNPRVIRQFDDGYAFVPN